MALFKPISALQSYNELLNEATPDNPIILTENKDAKYAILDLADYEQYQRLRTSQDLMAIVHKARQGELHGLDNVEKELMNR
ncbi:MAG: prevent-host-death family protein [Lactobacillus sp.]|nr:prevent-host-death family protein [Lactobacillus sp.]